MEIRLISNSNLSEALSLVKKVFMEFEAPDYCEEGVADFMQTMANPDYIGMHTFYGAYDGDKLVAVSASRNGNSHIGLLFVEGDYQRKGIGRMLIDNVLSINEAGFVTVNSSPYGHGFYKKLGFVDTDTEQVINGVRFFPMRLEMMSNNRICLRKWQNSDAEALFKYASDPDVGPRAGWAPHKSIDESREIIATVFNNPTTWAIVDKNTDEAIGAMGFMFPADTKLPCREGEPMVGYWVAKPFWNKGICTEALNLMLEYIRATEDYVSLISSHFVDNPASGRVLEKCGFLPTGEEVFDDSLYGGTERPVRVLRLWL